MPELSGEHARTVRRTVNNIRMGGRSTVLNDTRINIVGRSESRSEQLVNCSAKDMGDLQERSGGSHHIHFRSRPSDDKYSTKRTPKSAA